MSIITQTIRSTKNHMHHELDAPQVTVFADRCAGCQECVVRCPTAALSMDQEHWIAVADNSLCVGCRQCVRSCPFSAISVAGPMMVAPRAITGIHHANLAEGDAGEIRLGIPTLQDAIVEANRCLACPDPTCVRGCPAHNDIPSFLGALRDGDLLGAHHVLRRTSVLPDICSRVCDQSVQCEGSCTWSLAGGTPVAIGALERFIADNCPVPAPSAKTDTGKDMRVAVIGSGPAGIAAAWELTQNGVAVSVYEKDEEPGGLLRWGIPDFTLPAEVAMRPWAQLTESGVELHCKAEIHASDIDELLTKNDAVVLAHGAGVAMRLPIQGTDLEGVMDATQFLNRAYRALEEHHPMGQLEQIKRPGKAPVVLVLGGGNTAMDVARSARRLGANAICVDWLDRRFAPVRPDELAEAEQEGVEVRFSTTLQSLQGHEGHVTTAHLAHTRQKKASVLPKVDKGDIDVVAVDLVVMAMGYRSDPEFATVLQGTPIRKTVPELAPREWMASGMLGGAMPAFARHQEIGKLALGRELATSRSANSFGPRCWAAGDALVGPSTVVEAMAQGRTVAHAILAAGPQASKAPSI